MEVPGFKLGRQYDSDRHYKSFSALNLKNHKTVDIQIFHPSLSANQAFTSQFKKITQKLINCNYGIISPVLHAEILDHACYVITEHHSCTQKIFSTSLNSKKYQVLQMALKISQSLDELHKVRVIHGGIDLNALCFKASDILVLRPPKLQLVIPLLRSMTLKSMTPEQRRYLAPEAYQDLTPATDYYALGVLLYQLLFGADSFNADSYKSQAQYIFKRYKELEYLFMKLLTEDASNRIQNHDQFKAALQRCGSNASAENRFYRKSLSNVKPKKSAARVTSRSHLSWIIPTAGVAVTVLAGLNIISLTQQETLQQTGSPELQSAPASEANNIDLNAFEVTPGLSKTDHHGASAGFNKLYQSALAQLQTNPETALLVINVALKQKPGDTQAINLKKRIVKQIEIDSILADAETLLSNMQLLTPEGDNAYESYKKLAKLLSPDDERVIKGFTRIASIYRALSENEVEKNQLDKALEYIDLGLSVKSDYPQLLELRSSIVERQKMMEAELQLVQQDQEQRLREQQLTGKLIRNQVNQIKQTKQKTRQNDE